MLFWHFLNGLHEPCEVETIRLGVKVSVTLQLLAPCLKMGVSFLRMVVDKKASWLNFKKKL
jgi:hypothetical protein